jgi:hypothetical protein
MLIKINLCAILFFAFFSVSVSQTEFEHPKWKFFRDNRPSVEVSYGFSDIRLNTSPAEISDAGMFELRLGFTEQKKTKYGKDLIDFSNRYVFLSNASDEYISKSPGASSVNNTMWRFGFGNKEGYGVKLGSVAILPYNSISFSWSEFKYENNQNIPDSNYSTLNDFNDAFRFGSSTEAGLNIQLFKGFSISPMYEISDIFPRHLFGKQFMSTIIEMSGLVLLDAFTRQIIKNSPVAGAFVDFILKNAYEYGFYQLRKDQMNWPFTSTAPLRYNTFKIGMNFSF